MSKDEALINSYIQRVSSLEPKDLRNLQAILSRAVNEQVTPGLSLWVGVNPQQSGLSAELSLHEGRHEPNGLAPLITDDSLFDLASLTKPLAGALWFASLVSQQKLDPHQPISTIISCEDDLLGQCPIWRLANHSTGLPAHYQYFLGFAHARMTGGSPQHFKQRVRRMIGATPLSYYPGEKTIYSDLGYLLLEQICEEVSGESLDVFWEKYKVNTEQLHFKPLQSTTHTASKVNENYVPTERCSWRKRLLQGEVHDDNAWLMGGVCGHAGLFGTAKSVGEEASRWLRAFHGDYDESWQKYLQTSVLQWMLDYERRAPMKGSYVVGWDTPSPGYSSAGQFFSRHSIGHLGFTGTSLWMDLSTKVIIVLLTNRVYPDRNQQASIQGIRWLRPQIHNEVWRLLQA